MNYRPPPALRRRPRPTLLLRQAMDAVGAPDDGLDELAANHNCSGYAAIEAAAECRRVYAHCHSHVMAPTHHQAHGSIARGITHSRHSSMSAPLSPAYRRMMSCAPRRRTVVARWRAASGKMGWRSTLLELGRCEL